MSQRPGKHRWLPALILASTLVWQSHPMEAHAEKAKHQGNKGRQSKLQAQLSNISRQVKTLQVRDLKKTNDIKKLGEKVKRLSNQLETMRAKAQLQYRSCIIKGYHQAATGDGTNNRATAICDVTFTPPSNGLLLAQMAGFGSNESGKACRYGIRFNGEKQTGIHSGEVYFSTDRKTKTFHAIFPVASTRALRVTKGKKQKVSIVMIPMKKAKCTATAIKLHVIFIPGA